MNELITLGVIFALLLLNGLFVAAEFAIVAVPRAAIDKLAAKNHGVAKRIKQVLTDPAHQDAYIATAQLGVTAASLGLGMYGEHELAGWIYGWLERWSSPSWLLSHTVASAISVAILAYFHVVLGEVIPKALALQQAERAALAVTPIMLFTKKVCYPLVMLLNGCGNLILSSLGIRRLEASPERYYTPEDLQYIVRESQEGGMLRLESSKLLRKLFRFGDLTAGEVMVPRVRVTAVQVGCAQAELVRIVKNSAYTRYPVYEGSLDTIIGFLHIKDVLRRLLENRSIQRSDIRPVPFVPETAPLDKVLEIMRRKRVQMVVVMDEHGGTDGIVTIESLFDEIVGNIDERNQASTDFKIDASDRLRVSGTVRLEVLGERLQRVLTHEEVDTVSGLVLSLLGRPPRLTDVVEHQNVRFEVSAIARLGVKECIVTPLEIPQAQPDQEWSDAKDHD